MVNFLKYTWSGEKRLDDKDGQAREHCLRTLIARVGKWEEIGKRFLLATTDHWRWFGRVGGIRPPTGLHPACWRCPWCLFDGATGRRNWVEPKDALKTMPIFRLYKALSRAGLSLFLVHFRYQYLPTSLSSRQWRCRRRRLGHSSHGRRIKNHAKQNQRMSWRFSFSIIPPIPQERPYLRNLVAIEAVRFLVSPPSNKA